jgi:hypothetical protein
MSLMRNHLRLVLDRTSGELVRVDHTHIGDPAPKASVSPHSPAAPERARSLPATPRGEGAESMVVTMAMEVRP